MIINDGLYAPSTVTTSAPALSPGAGAKVKKNLSRSTDVADVAAALTEMVDFMVNGRPVQFRVNGRRVPPPENRWKR